MKSCPYCRRENPDDLSCCRYYGDDITQAPAAPNSIWKRLPAWIYIILIVGGIAALVFAIIGSFIALATIEGVASMVLLVLGIIGFGVLPLRKPENAGSFTRAIGLSFFALMGASVDQTGNRLCNAPAERCMCQEGTALSRGEIISNPIPGTTYIEQDFTSFDTQGEPVKRLNIFAVLGIRFLEYILPGYLLIGLRTAAWQIKNNTRTLDVFLS